MPDLGQPPLSARLALKATLRQKATVLRMWLGDGMGDGVVDAAFARSHMTRFDEMTSRIYRRWRAMRFAWERDGFRGDPPWRMIEQTGKHEVRT